MMPVDLLAKVPREEGDLPLAPSAQDYPRPAAALLHLGHGMDNRWIVGAIGLAVLVAIMVGIAKLVDLARRRRRERAALRGKLTDALMRDERFVGLTLVPKVRLPFWTGSPARIRLVGVAPSTETRRAALETVRQVAAVERSDVEIKDRTRVVGGRATRAA